VHAEKMLNFLRERGVQRRRNGRRKLRLVACACCRLLGPRLSREQGRVLDVAEHLAEGMIDKEAQEAAVKATERSTRTYMEGTVAAAVLATLRPNAGLAANRTLRYTFDAWARDPQTPGIVVWERGHKIDRFQSDLFREIFGNPFRPVALDVAWGSQSKAAVKQ